MDLNSDVGESFGPWTMGDDAAVLASVTSANVACGFHAGDPSVARRTCELAAERGVVVGAHPSYRDLAGFGRRFVDVERLDLTDDVVYQVGALQAIAASRGAPVRYVKPHGALYHAVVHHEEQAAALVDAVLAVDPDLPLVTVPGAAARLATRAGLRVVLEGFPDRAYRPDGTLVPRTEPGAVVGDPAEIVRRALALAEGVALTTTGERVPVAVETLCLHGDHPGAAASAAGVRAAFEGAGLEVSSFL